MTTETMAVSTRLLTDWDPEDQAYWIQKGRRLANRNLIISIPALLLAFAVWMVGNVDRTPLGQRHVQVWLPITQIPEAATISTGQIRAIMPIFDGGGSLMIWPSESRRAVAAR